MMTGTFASLITVDLFTVATTWGTNAANSILGLVVSLFNYRGPVIFCCFQRFRHGQEIIYDSAGPTCDEAN
jgi:hypothetical protein